MATIKCPTNVTSITFATSGVKVPDAAGLVTEITPGEATGLVRGGSVQGGGNLSYQPCSIRNLYSRSSKSN